MSSFNINVLTPFKTLYQGATSAVTLPSAKGQLTVLKDHIPLIGQLAAGRITITMVDEDDEEVFEVDVNSGYFEITKDCCYIFPND